MNIKDEFFIYGYTGFTDNSVKELEDSFEEIGLRYYKPDGLGGGPGEIVQEIMIWLNIHDFWFGLLIGVLANRIDRIVSRIFEWLKKYKIKKESHVNYSLRINIIGIESYSLDIDLSKKYFRNDIIALIRKERNKNHRN